MSFPNGAVIDDFNRTNGTPGANWSLAHAFFGTALFQIISNQAAPSNDYVVSYYNVGTYGPDCEVWATMNVVETIAGDGPYVCLRLQQPGTGTLDGYALAVENSGDFKILKCTNGTFTQLGTTHTSTMSAGDKFGLEAISTTLTAYVKHGTNAWTSVFSVTDSTYSSAGYLGLYLGAGQATTRLDDFGGGTAVAAATSLTFKTAARRNQHISIR